MEGGDGDFLHETSKDLCRKLHQTGTFTYGNGPVITGLAVNSSRTIPMTFAGDAEKCRGAAYSDPYGTWSDVLVKGSLKITLVQAPAKVNTAANKIHLSTGTTCLLSDGTCLDMENGYTYWDSLSDDRCRFNNYQVLYEGLATRISDKSVGMLETVYALVSKDITFALGKKGTETVCGYEIITTEHPKLVIYEMKGGSFFATKYLNSDSNLDIFTYINSKFIYVERHVRAQMKSLYKDLLLHRCNLEREMLKNSLAIAMIAPDLFAYNFMKAPGYYAQIQGEVLYMIKCVPVEVGVLKAVECSQQLQVQKNGETWYLQPRTHILVKTAIQTTCNDVIPTMFRIENIWYAFLPNAVEAVAPRVIKPQKEETWHYKDPMALGSTGIYRGTSLAIFGQTLMFGLEKHAILNTFARGATGQTTTLQPVAIWSLFDTETLKQISQHATSWMWENFMGFSNISSGVIGIILVCHFIKLIVDAIIRGYTLHTLFGWSMRLLAALFASTTYLLVHLGRRNPVGAYELAPTEDPDRKSESQNENSTTQKLPPIKI